MDENEVKELFGSDYKDSPETDPWQDWAQAIEFKVSKQGQLLIGLGAGLGVVLLLNMMQGRIVVKLLKGHSEIVEAINNIVGGMVGSTTHPSGSLSYSRPSGRIDESKVAPVDSEEAEDLLRRMRESQASGSDEPEL